MKRTPEHEQLIDELSEKTGLRREVVESAADKVVKRLTEAMIEKAVEKLKSESLVAQHLGLADGGPVSAKTPVPRIVDTEYVVPRRTARRFREAARNIRREARLG